MSRNVNNKALLPQRDTKSTMTFLHDCPAQHYISEGRESMPQVSKTGTGITFVTALCPEELQQKMNVLFGKKMKRQNALLALKNAF
jgi:hypothetical protein